MAIGPIALRWERIRLDHTGSHQWSGEAAWSQPSSQMGPGQDEAANSYPIEISI
jgi:hypothetical protein